MADQIIKQPDGKYSVFSSIVDDFTVTDIGKEDLKKYMIDTRVEEYREKITGQIERMIEGADTAEKHPTGFSMGFHEALPISRNAEGWKGRD